MRVPIQVLTLYGNPRQGAPVCLSISAATIQQRPCPPDLDQGICEALAAGWQPSSFGDGAAPRPQGEVRVVEFVRPPVPGRWELLTLQAPPEHPGLPWARRYHPDQGSRECPIAQDFLPAVQAAIQDGWEPISYGFVYNLRGPWQRLALRAFRRPVPGEEDR